MGATFRQARWQLMDVSILGSYYSNMGAIVTTILLTLSMDTILIPYTPFGLTLIRGELWLRMKSYGDSDKMIFGWYEHVESITEILENSF